MINLERIKLEVNQVLWMLKDTDSESHEAPVVAVRFDRLSELHAYRCWVLHEGHEHLATDNSLHLDWYDASMSALVRDRRIWIARLLAYQHKDRK